MTAGLPRGGVEVASVDAKRFGDDFQHGHARVETRDGVLEDELRLAAERADVAVGIDGLPSHTTWPPDARTSWSAARASVDLPEPDSPTTPTASPGWMSRSDAVDSAEQGALPEKRAARRKVNPQLRECE